MNRSFYSKRIISLISVLILFSSELFSRELEKGDVIVLSCAYNVTFFTEKALTKNGPKDRLYKYVTDDVNPGDTLTIVRKYSDYDYQVRCGGHDRLMGLYWLLSYSSMGEKHYYHSSDKHISSVRLEYFILSDIDSWRKQYIHQQYYDKYGNALEVNSGKLSSGFYSSYRFILSNGHSYGFDPYIEEVGAKGLKKSNPKNQSLFSIDVVPRATIDRRFQKEFPSDHVDSLRSKYLHDTLYLASSLNRDLMDEVYSMDGRKRTGSLAYYPSDWTRFEKYSRCVISDISKKTRYSDGKESVESLGFGYYLTMHDVESEKDYPEDIPICAIDRLFLPDSAVVAYKDSVRLAKEQDLIDLEIARVERKMFQGELDKFETQLRELLINTYGEEIGYDIWWGKVRFGFTEEMCMTAYRYCGAYQVKNYVETPLGPAREIRFLEEKETLYFIDDKLVGIVTYGTPRWM